jgi:hypothetical protein
MTMFEPLLGADGDFIVVLLGGFGLFYGSALLRVPRASQRLVAFLALHGGMVRRAAVAGWTCPGFPDASYLLGSLLPAAVVSFASYSSGLR